MSFSNRLIYTQLFGLICLLLLSAPSHAYERWKIKDRNAFFKYAGFTEQESQCVKDRHDKNLPKKLIRAYARDQLEMARAEKELGIVEEFSGVDRYTYATSLAIWAATETTAAASFGLKQYTALIIDADVGQNCGALFDGVDVELKSSSAGTITSINLADKGSTQLSDKWVVPTKQSVAAQRREQEQAQRADMPRVRDAKLADILRENNVPEENQFLCGIDPLVRIPPLYPVSCRKDADNVEVVAVSYNVVDGNTDDLSIVASSNACFNEAVTRTVKRWKYTKGNNQPPVNYEDRLSWVYSFFLPDDNAAEASLPSGYCKDN